MKAIHSLLPVLTLCGLGHAQSATLDIYFDTAATQTEIDVAPLTPFDIYFICDNVPTGVWGYEFYVNMPPELVIISATAHPAATSLDFGSGLENFIVGTGVCMNGPGPILLAEYTCMLLAPASGLELTLGPSIPSSFNDVGPGYAECNTAALFPFVEAYPGPARVNPTLGENYCTATANSVSPDGSRMSADGSTSLADQNLVLIANNAPQQPAIFYFGPNQTNLAFGNGFRCVGGSVVRLPAVGASGGLFQYAIDFVNDPITVGTHNFQCWYRDPAGGGTFFNLSDGLEITLNP